MKHWQETSRIVDRVLALASSGAPAALGTVVRIEGSAYRRPGAKVLIDGDGGTLGSVSGGCLEADVREVALQVLRNGEPRLRHYDTGSDEHTVWGLGLGCNGAVEVFVQAVTVPGLLPLLRRIHQLLLGDDPFAISTVVAGTAPLGRIVVVRAADVEGSTGDAGLDRAIVQAARQALAERRSTRHRLGPAEVFTEVCLPPPWLVVCGAGDDAIPLALFGAQVGFRVAVADHRPAYLSRDRFPSALRLQNLRPEDDIAALPLGTNSYAVVMNHSLVHDRAWVQRLLATDARYIGLLGPRDRCEEILAQIDASWGGRVYGPVGLDLGADGPEQVALSVVAEVLTVLYARAPRHLRDRNEAIHAG